VSVVTLRRITVYMAANPGVDPAFADSAQALGAALAHHGIGLVYGGGNVGLMGAVADGCLGAGGSVTGVITSYLADKELAHRSVRDMRVVDTMHQRKALMAELGDAFIALPGGFGTMDEVMEVLTWTQLGIHAKPVVFLNTADFWTPLMTWLDGAVEAGFVRDSHRPLARLAATPTEAIALAVAPLEQLAPKWIGR
jgi:uncharacterized protein (TIGR00730 family)